MKYVTQVVATSLSALAVIALSGCATKPSKVQPTVVDTARYEDYDCSQIQQAMADRSDRIVALNQKMKEQAGNDAAATGVAIVLFWPAAFAVSGGNETQVNEYKQLRGEYEALQKLRIQKSCDFDVKSPTERLRAAENEDDDEDRNTNTPVD